jgi:uncharacterized Zn finger protein
MSKRSIVKCGNCGCKTATIHAVAIPDGLVGFSELTLTCTDCGEVTVIKPWAPRIDLKPAAANQGGEFCAGWSEDE